MVLFGLAVFFEVGEIFLWMRFLERYRVRGGVEGMPGERATVLEPCDPDGIVRVRGEVWRARADGDALDEGDRVTVLAVDGLMVTVRGETR